MVIEYQHRTLYHIQVGTTEDQFNPSSVCVSVNVCECDCVWHNNSGEFVVCFGTRYCKNCLHYYIASEHS